MSHSERDDYDDFPPQKIPYVNPDLKQAGTYWMVFWAWFLVPCCLLSVIEIIQQRPRIEVFGIALILGVNSLAGAAFNGSWNIRKGSDTSLLAIAVGSSLFALLCGIWGIIVGFEIFAENDSRPTLIERIQTTGAIIWSIVFFLIACNAVYFTVRYRTTNQK